MHGSFQTSSRNFHVDGESNDSKKNVGEESKVCSVITLRARMAKKTLKTLDNNSGVRRSTRIKYPIQILTYDGFVAHHYAYMVKIIQKFEMKDLGELHYFLSIEVIQSLKRIWLLQRQYALNKLSEYGMTSCKPILIPLEQNVKLSANERDLVEDTTMYRHIVRV